MKPIENRRGAMRVPILAGLLLASLLGGPLTAQRSLEAPTSSFQRLALALRKIPVSLRVLYVTAHPDDEDNATLSLLAHGQGVETTLLTLTRGAGGQNRLGPELEEPLAVLRMEELRAARCWDGARQLLGPVRDFGYSFSEEETFELWGRRQTLHEIVAAIRDLRPHILLTMPARWPGGGRHHQASAQLAQEAVDLAASGDHPELGKPHRVDRVFEQVWTTAGQKGSLLVRAAVHELDPILGGTHAEVGLWARAEHKCQTMLQVEPTGLPPARGLWKLVAGKPLDQEDRSLWGGLSVEDPLCPKPRGAAAWSDLNAARPAAVEAELRRALEALPEREETRALRERLERAWALSLGVHVDATVPRSEAAPGDAIDVSIFVHNRSARRLETRLSLEGVAAIAFSSAELEPGGHRKDERALRLPGGTAPSGVRFRPGSAPARYAGAVEGLPSTAALRIVADVRLGERWIRVAEREVTHRREAPSFPRQEILSFRVAGALEGSFAAPVLVLPAGEGHQPPQVTATVRSRSDLEGELLLTQTGPDGKAQLLVSQALGDGPQSYGFEARVQPTPPGRSTLSLVYRDSEGRTTPIPTITRVAYPHIKRTALLRDAKAELVVAPMKLPADRRIAYLPAPEDRSLPVLRSLLPVHELDPEELFEERLDDFDVIVLGVRSYGTRPGVRAAHDRLMAWVRRGGHLILQYERPARFNGPRGQVSPWVPAPARVGTRRATEEGGPIHFLLPQHPFLKQPNRITASDFAGWIQDRAVYLLDPEGEGWEEILAVEDRVKPNAGIKPGALVSRCVGKGRWSYTGLAFFRQLPAGVPGAWRLFLNLLDAR